MIEIKIIKKYSKLCLRLVNKQKQPSRGVVKEKCTENMQQLYRRTPMPKCDFNNIIKLWHGRSPVSLLHIFRTLFLKNTAASE